MTDKCFACGCGIHTTDGVPRKKLNTMNGPLDEEVITLAHRMAWRFRLGEEHGDDQYIFNEQTLLQFAHAILGVFPESYSEMQQAQAWREVCSALTRVYGVNWIQGDNKTGIESAVAAIEELAERGRSEEAQIYADALQEIGDFAHDHSKGPAEEDILWEVRYKAYYALDKGGARE